MKELIGLDFFTKAFFPSHLKVRGETVYFIGKKVNDERNAYDSDVYRLEGGEAVRLTASRDVKAYALLDEGIVFASLRKKKDREAAERGEPLTVFQLLPYDGGEAREYLRLPYVVEQAEWLPGGRLVFRATVDHTMQSFLTEYEGNLEKALATKREQDEAVNVVDELPYWFNGEGFINKRRSGIYLCEGGGARLVTNPYAHTEKLVVNEAGTLALYTRQIYEDMRPADNELCLLDLRTGQVTKVAGVPEGLVDDCAFGPDGRAWFLHVAKDSPYGLFVGNPALCSVSLTPGQHRMTVHDDSGLYSYCNSVGSDMKLGIDATPLTAADGALHFLATLGGDSHILRYALEKGPFAQVTRASGMVCEFCRQGDGYAMIAMRGDRLCELYHVADDGAETRLSHFNDALLDAHEVVTPLPLTFVNTQGDEIQGWVMPPVNYVPGKSCPSILNIHGGPKTAYGSVFFHEMQYWCAQGYAVLFCNPTGSDGRGSRFADIRGRYGTVDYEDIMAFVDEAQTRFGFVSTMRMGVTGGSYGGFMTNWIIGHTDRFRAAAAQRSISNWVGFANTSDIGYTFGADQMQATPWTDVEALWRASPVRYADKVKTPTLFIHSEEDYRCNQFEGFQMFYALRQFGVDTRMCLFKGENHELSRSGRPRNRVRRIQEITRWMDKYLRTH